MSELSAEFKGDSLIMPSETSPHQSDDVIKEWQELHQWAENQLEAIDPTFIANEESLSPEELFTKGLGLILGSFKPREKAKS